jgi:ABC-type multidrug transport system ATPase subunit
VGRGDGTPAAAPLTVAAATDFTDLELRDVSRLYGRRRALWHASLAAGAGEVVGLFGPNGAGKSTLLGLVSTLMRPTSGGIYFGGKDATTMGDALRGRIGLLGHDLFLYSELTARENLEFFGALYGVTSRARIDAALERARLSERASDRVSGFSRGLRQRLALERALIHEPRVVLLDEPFTGLDVDSTDLLIERLRALKAAGAIVIMATHDFDSAERVIDRMVCVKQGRLREPPPSDVALKDRYRALMAEAWA